MGAFLRIILYVILIFYAFSLVIKLIFRRKTKKLQRQMERHAQNEAETYNNETKNPHIDPGIGEYTDYEEIQ